MEYLNLCNLLQSVLVAEIIGIIINLYILICLILLWLGISEDSTKEIKGKSNW